MNKFSKYKGVIVVVGVLILVLNTFAYINTYVSEKYELQLIGIKKDIDLNEIKIKENQIKNQRIFLVGFSLLLLSGIVYIIGRNDNKDNIQR